MPCWLQGLHEIAVKFGRSSGVLLWTYGGSLWVLALCVYAQMHGNPLGVYWGWHFRSLKEKGFCDPIISNVINLLSYPKLETGVRWFLLSRLCNLLYECSSKIRRSSPLDTLATSSFTKPVLHWNKHHGCCKSSYNLYKNAQK